MPPPFIKPAPPLSKMATYLVTGSSRGLGFNIVNHLASRPASEVGTIFATSRQTVSTQLQELIEREKGRVAFVELDAASQSSVKEALGEVERQLQGQGLGQETGEKGIDVLINNAGYMPSTKGGVWNMYVSVQIRYRNLALLWIRGQMSG